MIGLAHSAGRTLVTPLSCVHNNVSFSTVAAARSAASHGGIPIGAVQLDSSHVQQFWDLINRTLPTERGEKICYRGVQPFVGPRNRRSTDDGPSPRPSDRKSRLLLVHVAPAVAAALDGDDGGHPVLSDFLKRCDGAYLPGLRRSRTHRNATRRSRNATHQLLPAVPPTEVANGGSRGAEEASFTFSELFAGIGGFRLGLESVGGRCVFANEIDPYAASIYRRNFASSSEQSHGLIEADILDVCAENDVPRDIDILTAGFPCQPFSTRGEQRGLQDEKGQMYREIVRVLRASRPKSFICENVSGLVGICPLGTAGKFRGHGRKKEDRDVGSVFQTVLSAFEDCGYNVTWNICNSRHYVAQQRERVFIVGLRKDLACGRDYSWDWYNRMLRGDLKTDATSMVMRDIMEPPHSRAVSESVLSPKQWAKLQEVHSKRSGIEFACVDIEAKVPTLISSYRRSGNHTSKYIFYERDGTKREVPRFLTPRECCRIQGFPENYTVPSIETNGVVETAHFYSGIGNAVVPQVVADIGKEILRCLRS